jgi:CMP-N,N'-diacetyllegionaminic acid synthase
MIKNKRVLAFIGARAGSKGLVDKNIKLLNGLPLIAWTIKSALASKYIDEVVFSSDSEVYLDIAKGFGASVVHRPAELSHDSAALIDAIKHAHHEAVTQFGSFDIIVNLQPTSPLRNEVHIDQAVELFLSSYAKNSQSRLISCYEVKNKYAWVMRKNDEGFAQFIDSNERNKSSHGRQTNPQVLLPNGAIYILPAIDITQFYNEATIPFIMKEEESIDVDYLEDFITAEHLMQS